MPQNPEIKIPFTIYDLLLEIMGWITLTFFWGLTLFHYSSLPDEIPVHYDALGNITRTGDKQTLFILPILGTLIFFLLGWVSRHPENFNYPITITKKNAQKQYTFAIRLIRYIKWVCISIFLIIDYQTIQIGLEKAEALGSWLFPAFLLALFLPVVFYLYQTRKLKKNDFRQNIL